MAIMGLSEPLYMISAVQDQPDRIENSKGTFLYRLILETELEIIEYLQRPIWLGEYVPGFTTPGKRGRRIQKTDSLINLPIFAKYAKLRFDQIPMKRLLVKLHEPENVAHIKKMKDLL